MLKIRSIRLSNKSLAMSNDKIGTRLVSITMINKITTKISIFLDQKVCGVPMMEMVGMRILCYVLLAVIIIRIFGD